MGEVIKGATTFGNNITGTIGAQQTVGSLSLTLGSGQGAQFGDILTPSENFILLTQSRGPLGSETVIEITKYTTRSGDVLSGGTRAQQGTTATQWEIGDRFQLRLTAGSELIGQFFTKEFISAEQTIGNADTGSFAHNLGGKPRIIQYKLICKVAELGYSVDDEVYQDAIISGNSNNGVVFILDNADDITYRVSNSSNTFDLLNKSNGAPSSITSTNWRLIVTAYR